MKNFLLAFALGLPLVAADSFVIRNATVHPVSGPEMPNASVVVVDGKIAEVGAKVTVPKGAKVIEGKGLHVYPGMIDSATEAGVSEIGSVRETNDTGELGDFNPQLKVLSAVNPASEHIPVIRGNGTTTVITLPFTAGGGGGGRGGGSSSLITGQMALIHLDGWTWEDMAVKPSAAMELVFPAIAAPRARFMDNENPLFPRTVYSESKRAYDKRIKELEAFFEQARRYQKAKAAKEAGFKTDLKFEAMLPVLDGKLPVMVTASREKSIKDAIAFADKERIKIVIAGAREYGSTMADLKAKGIPVITPAPLALPINEDDPYDQQSTLPAELYKAGVKFAFGTFNNQFARNLPFEAAHAVGFGLPKDAALRAVTLNAAEIWGVGDQIGSIDKGKWADLVVTDDDLLEAKTKVKMMFIKGKAVDLESKHTKLYEKYLARP